MSDPVINLDWFSFSIHAHHRPSSLPQQFEEEILQGNNVFKQRAIYRYRGAKVMTVLSQTKSKILDGDLCLIEIANRWLYDYCDLENIMETMFPIRRFSNMSRIDICADFCPDAETMGTIENLAKGDYYVSGKKLGSVWYEETGCRHPYCLNFGSVQSDVKWKLYNKSKEINATGLHCTKPWIVAHWKNHNLPRAGVWRLEVSYHGEKFSDEYGNYIGMFDLYNVDLLRIMFAEFYKYRFTVKKRGHTRKVNDEVIPFLTIPEMTEPYITRPRAIVGGRYDDSDEGRILLDRLVKSYTDSVTLSHSVKIDTILLIRRLCSEYGYFGYVRDKFEWDFENPCPRKVLRG